MGWLEQRRRVAPQPKKLPIATAKAARVGEGAAAPAAAAGSGANGRAPPEPERRSITTRRRAPYQVVASPRGQGEERGNAKKHVARRCAPPLRRPVQVDRAGTKEEVGGERRGHRHRGKYTSR